ncbi:MAG: Ribosomal RNA small subunit methyltransferase E [candidate division WS6 bacterium GW2011_GWA2_37_6]|uniref:16S rRNA (uracil(1498)-N(3))-methyltransferase n=1 Tax=candidate division WS6 bacterium GW2011_GWA2_37_6 TaxID=1619087 RepID=A0A0G0H9Q1_9BACT|nr:MAG: Ribosomal RNA small subunit methyltransferase E [candidate division WS6 bacterium GW2011_GWA2_37_6]
MSTIPRFFIPPEKIIGGEFILEDGQDIKKIRKVLRLESGDKIELNNNQGNLFLAQIEKLQKEAVSGIIIEEIELKEVGHNKPYLILAQALPKGGKMDDIIRMNTEVGVDEFIPFESEFSVVKVKDLRDKKLGKKLIRWSKIAQEAARQT